MFTKHTKKEQKFMYIQQKNFPSYIFPSIFNAKHATTISTRALICLLMFLESKTEKKSVELLVLSP